MSEITVRLRVITDISPPKQDTQIRPPSLKGLLRHWWRVSKWGGDDRLSDEGKIFGAAGSDEGEQSGGQGLIIVPKKSFFNAKHADDILDFTMRHRCKESLAQATDALKLMCYLGGIGAHTRRGEGSLQLDALDDVSVHLPTIPEIEAELLKICDVKRWQVHRSEPYLDAMVKTANYPAPVRLHVHQVDGAAYINIASCIIPREKLTPAKDLKAAEITAIPLFFKNIGSPIT